MRVVCLKDSWKVARKGLGAIPTIHPVKGEIYSVKAESDGAYLIDGFPHAMYSAHSFRPVDDTFGPNICEIIEQQVELETIQS
jgi:hypothetical protein